MSKAEIILREIEKRARNEFLPIIGPDKGQVLVEEIRKAKPKRVLEVGTLIGYSAILMGKELDENAQIISIELHAEEAKTAEENVQKAEIPPKVKVVTGDAIQVIPKLKGVFDFVVKFFVFGEMRVVVVKVVEGAVDDVGEDGRVAEEDEPDQTEHERHEEEADPDVAQSHRALSLGLP